jgi:hypothetical protein
VIRRRNGRVPAGDNVPDDALGRGPDPRFDPNHFEFASLSAAKSSLLRKRQRSTLQTSSLNRKRVGSTQLVASLFKSTETQLPRAAWAPDDEGGPGARFDLIIKQYVLGWAWVGTVRMCAAASCTAPAARLPTVGIDTILAVVIGQGQIGHISMTRCGAVSLEDFLPDWERALDLAPSPTGIPTSPLDDA